MTYSKPRLYYQRVRTPSIIKGESRTHQSHKDETDVNTIVARYQRTGELPPNPRGLEPTFEDVTGLQQDLTEAYNKSIEVTTEYDKHLKHQEELQQQADDLERQQTQEGESEANAGRESVPVGNPE